MRGEEFQYFMILLFCHYFPITTVHIYFNKIICFCVNILHRIINARYEEDEWSSELVQFLVWHTQPPLVLVPWHIYWCSFAARTTNSPLGPSSYSTTLFVSKLSTRFSTTLESSGTYIGGSQQIGRWLPVSIWNGNPRTVRRNPSSQNIPQYSATSSLNLSGKSLGQPNSFIFFSNYFVFVLT